MTGQRDRLHAVASDYDIDALMADAQAARANAYAPYSGFTVGAAVLTDDGTVVRGANVENASYSLTVCAERVAVCNAVAAGHTKLTAIAIDVDADNGQPCGSCRQFLSEFNGDLQVSFVQNGDVTTMSLSQLLPNAFHRDSLNT